MDNDLGFGDADFADVHEVVGELVEEITERMGSDAQGWNMHGVPWVPCDGFFPHTDGGWQGTVYDTIYPSDGSLPLLIQGYQESDQANFEKTFWEAHGVDVDDNVLVEALLYCYPELEEERSERAMEWEQAEEDVWFIYLRAFYYGIGNRRNDGGKPEVYFNLAINTDFNYGRTSISWLNQVVDHTLWEEDVPVDELTPEKVEEIKNKIIEAWHASYRAPEAQGVAS